MRWIVVLSALVVACGGAEEEPRDTVFGGDRPATLRVPGNYEHGEPTPLLLVLHGYGVNGAAELGYARLDRLVADPGVLVLAPDGTRDSDGNLFWNTGHAGCTVGAGVSAPDDAAYLVGLLDEVAAQWTVDPKRIYVFGHSNGGFMAHRLACQHSDRIAAIVSLAGALAPEESNCAPTQPVSVLQLHGDADDTVSYGGGTEVVGHACPYLGAADTALRWAGHNGCMSALTDAGTTFDLDGSIDGAETSVSEHGGCAAGGAVQVWTMAGGEHIPSFVADVSTHLWSFLDAHPKP